MQHPDQVKIFVDLLIALSFLAVIFAVYGYFGTDLWLASTQWLLTAVVLSSWAIYFSLNLKK